uniref:Protein kinase domain-containing protein n=1 Tax=Rhizophagus irregularis (strain DAOM 181602 / DAOM 197198 / MUCL 43194) TaxID=747089 RepID=U9U6W2_RHIID
MDNNDKALSAKEAEALADCASITQSRVSKKNIGSLSLLLLPNFNILYLDPIIIGSVQNPNLSDLLLNVEKLDEGVFGIIYKAIYEDYGVVLKHLNYFNNSNESLNEFLNELKHYKECLRKFEFINLYGFTKNPDTLKYMNT